MSLSIYYFRFSLLGTVLCILGLAIFSSLGYWQVSRAEFKRDLEQQMLVSENSPALYLNSSIDNLNQNYYRTVKLMGYYDHKHEILMDNKVYRGKPGYHVYTPLKLDNSTVVVMVNRGWVDAGRDRRNLPDTTVSKGPVELTGKLYPLPSRPPLVLDNDVDPGRLWIYFDMDKYSKITTYKLIPALILLDKDAPDGYIRDWPKYDAKVDMHVGYSIMWFAFATIVLVTYIGVNFKKKANDDNN